MLPEIAGHLYNQPTIKASGGWLSAMAEKLEKTDEIELTIATVSGRVNELVEYQGEKSKYFVIPSKSSIYEYSKKVEKYWRIIKNKVQPNLVHIHGTEYPFGLAYVNSCGPQNVVVSIQGMPSEIAKYCTGGLGLWEIIRNITIRDIIKGDSIFHEIKNMNKSGNLEQQLLRRVSHVIGRTSWDRIHSIMINDKLQYHKCNESLREPFYNDKWSYEACKKHTIFVSQFHCPLKGFHILLDAVVLIRQQYPDVQIRVAGGDIMKQSSMIDFIKQSGYARILKNKIRRYHLEDSIIRMGSLDANQMKKELLLSNIYVCPSSIENSPNSLGEAQLLGVPCVASYVGGIPDFMAEVPDKLYRYDDIKMLAYKICEVFKEKEKASYDNMSYKKRHDRELNLMQLLEIYKSIVSNR